jgi:hypothetical protein
MKSISGYSLHELKEGGTNLSRQMFMEGLALTAGTMQTMLLRQSLA